MNKNQPRLHMNKHIAYRSICYATTSVIRRLKKLVVTLHTPLYHMPTREYELREPIPHIELCTYHDPRSSIFKRNGIGQIVKTVKT